MESNQNEVQRPAPRATGLAAWVQWYGLGRVVTVCTVVCAVVAGGWWLLRPTPLPVETRIPIAATREGSASAGHAAGVATTHTSTTFSTTAIVVDIVGAVHSPGLYHLIDGSRVDDLVRLAGGVTAEADLEHLNLARRVADGEQIVIPRRGDPVVSTEAPASFPVHVNSATVDDLDRLPGVGPATAAAIVAYRTQHGPFTSLDQLAQVRGIGAAKLDAIRPMVAL